jgi:hypothetical protein
MQKRILLSAAVLAALAACSSYDPYYSSTPPNPDPNPSTTARAGTPPARTPAPTASTNMSAAPGSVSAAPVASAPLSGNVASGTAPGTVAYRPGNGVIESMSLVYQPITRPTSASSGGSIAPDPGPYRMTVRMEDGSLQSLVVDNRSFMVGDRIQLTADGRVNRM